MSRWQVVQEVSCQRRVVLYPGKPNSKKIFLKKFSDDKEPIPQATGKYLDLYGFDFRAFGFHQQGASHASVTYRKCLEVAYEAIVDAGIPVRRSKFHNMFRNIQLAPAT